MSKTIFTIKIDEVKPKPVVFLDMISTRRNDGPMKSKKVYSRKEKHKKDYF